MKDKAALWIWEADTRVNSDYKMLTYRFFIFFLPNVSIIKK